MDAIAERKREHLEIAVKEEVEEYEYDNWLRYVHLIHYACSEISPDTVNLKTRFLNHEFKIPIMIEALTGGCSEAKRINKILAEACQEAGVGMYVGSQRAALKDPSLTETYSITRKVAPDIFLVANIGAAQIVSEEGVKDALRAIEMIEADAISIHLNLAHEILQPEGDTSFRGLLRALEKLREEVDIPIIVKEVGFGISKEAALKLSKTGISAIDVAGRGGTSWAKIEWFRLKSRGLELKAKIAMHMREWGIPTAASILEVRTVLPNIPLVGSGGVRTGLDIAKVIALGANIAGIGLPFLKYAYFGGKKKVLEYISELEEELRAVIALTGFKSVDEFRGKAPYVIVGELYQWAIQRKLKFRGE